MVYVLLAIGVILFFWAIIKGGSEPKPQVGHICPACGDRHRNGAYYCNRCLEEINSQY